MASTAQMRILPAELSFRVLQADPSSAPAGAAARAVLRYVLHKRPGLARALSISAEGASVVVTATGESPEAMLAELRDLLRLDGEPEESLDGVAEFIEVDPAEFVVHPVPVPEPEQDVELRRVLLRSVVRYFPYPVCEWFEVRTGELVLTQREIVFEPEYELVTEDPVARQSGLIRAELAEVVRCYRGEWWDIPCLMVETGRVTYRFGWPAQRGEPETIFDVDEWLGALRRMLEDVG